MPLDRAGVHGAETAARAAICAEVQGQFQAMHSVLLESNDWRDSNDWTALAKQVSIRQYERCLTGRMAEEKLAED